MSDSVACAAMSGTSPAFEQVRDFPTWGELVPDAVRVDLLELRGMLGGEHHITRMNDLPNVRRRPGRLLPVHKPRCHPGLACQQRCLFQGIFGRLIFQVGIHHLKQLWHSTRFLLSEIEKHHWLTMRTIDGRSYHCIIVFVASAEHNEQRIWNASFQIGSHDWIAPPNIVDVSNAQTDECD